MTGDKTNDNGYPRILDRQGCLYGQAIEKRLNSMDEKVDKLADKVDRMRQALVATAISLATAALLLAANLVFN